MLCFYNSQRQMQVFSRLMLGGTSTDIGNCKEISTGLLLRFWLISDVKVANSRTIVFARNPKPGYKASATG